MSGRSCECCDVQKFIGQIKKYGGGKNWAKLAQSDIENGKLFESLQTYQSLIATLSGLISGFSYVVLSQESIDYETVDFVGADRADVSAGFVTFAFIASMACLIVESTLYFYAAFGGEDNIKDWVTESAKLVNIPVFLLIFAIALMLVGSVIHIGGLYSNVVYYAILIVGAIFFCIYIGLQIFLLSNQFDYLDKMEQSKANNANESKQANDVIPALQTEMK